jgi:hypothetical protein
MATTTTTTKVPSATPGASARLAAEQLALTQRRMISLKEANVRKLVGAIFFVISLALYFYDPLLISPWSFFALFGLGIGFFRTGVENE